MPDNEVILRSTGLWTPEDTLSNTELVESYNRYVQEYNHTHAKAIDEGSLETLQPSSTAFIEKASGIRSRHVMDKNGILNTQRMFPFIPERRNDEISVQAEMAVAAIRDALTQAALDVQDLDAVLIACSSMQRAYPAVSIEVQHYLGMDSGWGHDMNIACASATFGIQTAVDSIRNGHADCIAVVSPEITSAHLAWQDRDCHFIFGDAATAVIVQRAALAPKDAGWTVHSTHLKTRFSNNIRNNFGFLNRCAESGIGTRDKLFMQEGRKVFKEVCPMVIEHINQHLNQAGWRAEELQRLWLHQANLGMNELIARKVLGREVTRVEAPIILDTFANTSSAGSIIAFHLHQNGLSAGAKGLICAFGAGYSAGSVLVEKRNPHA